MMVRKRWLNITTMKIMDMTLNTGHINQEKASDNGHMTFDGEGIYSSTDRKWSALWYKNNL